MAISVSYSERHPQETLIEQGDILSRAATRILHCDWDDRDTLVDELLSPIDGNNVYPHNDWGITAYQFGIRPVGSQTVSAGSPTYPRAEILVKYSSAGPVTTELVTEEYVPVTSYHRISHEYFYIKDGAGFKIPMRPGDAPIRVEPVGHYKLTYHKLLTAPIDSRSLRGYINSNTVTAKILNLTFPPETLRYEGMQESHSILSGAITYLKATLFFTDRLNSWNRVYNPHTMLYSDVFFVNGDAKFSCYPTAAFVF